ncbi:MAG: response regulator, partial [Planctomycetota bacterium]
ILMADPVCGRSDLIETPIVNLGKLVKVCRIQREGESVTQHSKDSEDQNHDHPAADNGAHDTSDAKDDLLNKQVYTTGEAAEVCKVSQQTIIRCFDAGRLNGFRVPGSRFRRIPREELIRFMRENDIPSEHLGSGPKRLLLVDDDPEILALLTDWFEDDARFEIRTAQSGYDAGLETERFEPHVIVLDFKLPDINGNVVCERIRGSEKHRDVKILCVSGVVETHEVDRLLSAGADGFIKKPFDLAVLRERIEVLLGLESAAKG